MEAHAAVEGGVVKLQDCGVETKTASGQTVEGVADDGGVEPVGMGAVDAELVGASCGGVRRSRAARLPSSRVTIHSTS